MQIKTTIRYHLTPGRMGIIKKQITSVDKDMEKRGAWYTVSGNVNFGHLLWKILWSFLKKLKIELPYHPAIPLLGIYLKRSKALIWKINAFLFIAAVFTVAKIWKHPQFPSIDEWIKEMWYKYTHTQWTISHKKNEVLPFLTAWTILEYYA